MDKRDAWRAFLRRIKDEGRNEEFLAAWQRPLREGKFDSEWQAKYHAAQKFHRLDNGAHELHFFEEGKGKLRIEPSGGRHTPKGHGMTAFVKVAADPELGHIQPLIEAVDKRRTATGYEVMQWVFNNLLTPWSEIPPDEVPSIGALGYLRWARRDPKNETAFYQMWSKMLEKKSLADEENRRRDDGRKSLPLLEAFEKDLEAQSA